MADVHDLVSWKAVPRPGCRGVEVRVLLKHADLLIANLRFGTGATIPDRIDRHSAPHDVDVICLTGAGFTSVGDAVAALGAGQTVRWPAGTDHCLWTEDRPMETIMVERHGPAWQRNAG